MSPSISCLWPVQSKMQQPQYSRTFSPYTGKKYHKNNGSMVFIVVVCLEIVSSWYRRRQNGGKRENFVKWRNKVTLTNQGHHTLQFHDDVIKWKHFPRYWPFVRGIHRSPVNSPHKGQWRGALMFSLICVWIIGWVHNRETGDLKRYRVHYDVIVIYTGYSILSNGQYGGYCADEICASFSPVNIFIQI